MLNRYWGFALHVLMFKASPLLLAATSTAATAPQIEKTMRMGQEAQEAGDLARAETLYLSAYKASKELPALQYRPQCQALASLGQLYGREKRPKLAQDAYTERVKVLQTHAEDLELGIALFDLQSFYASINDLQHASQAAYQATRFYTSCMSRPERKTICDRRLADVQGLQGAYLFLRHNFTEAIPYFRAVASRKDDAVRPEVLESALLALYSIFQQNREFAEAEALRKRALRLRIEYPGARMVPLPGGLR